MARRLVRHEGVLCGQSCGASVAGAVKYAEMMGRKMKILAHLPDTAYRYLSKHLDDDWMRENGFMGPSPSMGRISQMLQEQSQGELITAQPNDHVQSLIGRMREHGISQVPVVENGRLMGILDEKKLLKFLLAGEVELNHPIGDLVENNFAVVDPNTPVASLSGLFNTCELVLVLDNGALTGVVTKIDLIEYMAKKMNS